MTPTNNDVDRPKPITSPPNVRAERPKPKMFLYLKNKVDPVDDE